MTAIALRVPRLRGARLSGFGSARPTQVVTGGELVARFGKDAAWLRERTGIESVRRLSGEDSLVELASAAARRALRAAGRNTAEMVIAATCSCVTPCEPAPLASRVAASVAPAAMAADLNAACSGFVLALASAADHVRAGSADTVVVVGAEQMSSMIDPADLGTSILFGDGAGAAVVEACAVEEDAFGPVVWFSDGGQADVLRIPTGSPNLDMDGPAVFRWAVATVPRLIREALARAGRSAGEIDVFVPHQANLRIIEPVRRATGLLHTPLADDIRTSGNTSAASIPMALSALGERHDLRRKLALVVGFGAGLAAAAQVVRLP